MTPKQQALKHIRDLPYDASFDIIEKKIYALNTANQVWKNRIGRWFFAFSGLFALACFLILIDVWLLFDDWVYTVVNKTNCKTQDLKIVDGIIYMIWLVIPPIWFLSEYVFFFDDKFKLQSNHQSDFKLTQDLASKFWGALVVLFGLILYIKYGFKP